MRSIINETVGTIFMKFNIAKTGFLSATVAAALLTAACGGENTANQEQASAEVTLDTVEKQVTYIVGYNMAKQAQGNGLEFQKEVMSAAIEDVLADKEPRIEQAEQQKIMMSFQEEQQQKREQELSEAGEENLQKSQEFLSQNAEKEGVEVTESGLQYQVLEAAEDESAPTPGEDDVVKVHYHGTLIDGTVFDSSVERGEPVSFPVKGVIQGWVEALQLMQVGEKFKLVIPPELAYGEAGTSGEIGPNQALIFEVELLEINPEIEGHGGSGSPH